MTPVEQIHALKYDIHELMAKTNWNMPLPVPDNVRVLVEAKGRLDGAVKRLDKLLEDMNHANRDRDEVPLQTP